MKTAHDRTRKSSAAWIVAGIVLIGTCATVAAQRLGPRAGLVDASYFGMHMHYMVKPSPAARTTAWPSATFGTWRLVDAYVKWSDLEPKRGQWNFSILDKYADLARKHGVSLLYTLGHPPKWASARPDEPAYTYGAGSAAEPGDLADWDNYVRTVATRYRGVIGAYEIWNEPKFSEVESAFNKQGNAAFYSGSAAQMVELARRAHRIIKEVDPQAKVLTPGFHEAEAGVKRLDLFLRLGGGAVTDVVAFHLYAPSPESMLPIIEKIRAVMDKHGIGDRELWNTETGYFTENPDEPKLTATGRTLNERDAAGYVARSLVLAAAAGVRRFYWYAWDNGALGLTVGRGRQPNMAAQAYEQTARWLRGAVVEACEWKDKKQWVCTLKRGSRTAWMVWRTEGSEEWSAPGSAVEMESLDGSRAAVPSTHAIRVQASPVLVKADTAGWSS